MNTQDTPNQDYSSSALKALTDALHNIAKEQRRIEALGVEASAGEIQALLREARSAFSQLCTQYVGQDESSPIATLRELAKDYWSQIAERKGAMPTGLKVLDDALGGGVQPGRLMVLLGAPGSGKTTLANQIGEQIANAGRPVVYVTSEDPPAVLLAKTVARIGSLDYGAVLRGHEKMRSTIDSALEGVKQRQSADRLLYVHDTGRLALDAIQEIAHAHFRRYGAEQGGGPGLLVIDYLQRLARSLMLGSWRGLGLDSRNAVSMLTDRLRSVAIELDCTVLALGSQSRASGYNAGDGALSSAKESGDIEYTSDVLAVLGKEDKERRLGVGHKAIPLQLAKNRQGEAVTIILDWFGTHQQFTVAQGGQ
jgi:replicative DNA helicase